MYLINYNRFARYLRKQLGRLGGDTDAMAIDRRKEHLQSSSSLRRLLRKVHHPKRGGEKIRYLKYIQEGTCLSEYWQCMHVDPMQVSCMYLDVVA